MTHTPGPLPFHLHAAAAWTYESDTCGELVHVTSSLEVAQQWHAVGYKVKALAFVTPETAAAPAMLEALHEAFFVLEGLCDHIENGREARDVEDMVRAAIAKAEGRS